MKQQAEQIRARLLSISTMNNVTFQHVQTMFLLERMVARLTREQKLFEHIIFKGGYVALRAFNSPRYTMDLDGLIYGAEIKSIEKLAIHAIESVHDDGTWFKYEKKADLQTLGEYGGIRYYFRGGIGVIPEKYLKAQSLHLDLAAGDSVIPAPDTCSLTALINNQQFLWKIYTIESAAAEKLHTLLVRGSDNSRSKDIYDLYRFLPQCRLSILKEALQKTFVSRGDRLPNPIAPVLKAIDRTLLRKGWKNATAGIVTTLSFDDAFEHISGFCQTIDLLP